MRIRATPRLIAWPIHPGWYSAASFAPMPTAEPGDHRPGEAVEAAERGRRGGEDEHLEHHRGVTLPWPAGDEDGGRSPRGHRR